MHKPSPLWDATRREITSLIEQHSFMLVLLKVLATKGESMLTPSTQIEQVTSYLKTYEATFPQNAQDTLDKVHLGGCDREYVSAVKTYALSAHKLLTPVSIWMIPYPTGHTAVFASPNKLSLVSTDSWVYRITSSQGQHIWRLIYYQDLPLKSHHSVRSSVQGKLTSWASCPLTGLQQTDVVSPVLRCTLQQSWLTTWVTWPAHLKSLAYSALSHLTMLKTTI